MALYLNGLRDKSLWRDEFDTLTFAGRENTWLDTLRLPLTIPIIPAPPLFYVLAHAFTTALGNDEFTLRLPSVLFATMSVPLIYALGKSFFDESVGLLSAFLLAIAPLHIRYAQEARGYAMLTFFSMLSLYLFVQALRTGERRWWIGFTTATIVNLYTHLFAPLTLETMALFAVWHLARRRREVHFQFQRQYFLLALVVILLAFSPLVPFFLKGLRSERGLDVNAVSDPWGLSWNLDSLLGAIRLFSGGNDWGAAIYLALFILGAVILAIKRRNILILNIMWIVLPVITVLSIPFEHRILIRYFIFILPVYLLLVAHGLSATIRWLAARIASLRRSTNLRLIVGLLMTFISLGLLGGISMPSIASYYAESKQNWRDATRLVQALAEPGDTILVTSMSGKPADTIQYQTGVSFYLDQWAQRSSPMTHPRFRILAGDIDQVLLSASDLRGWLFVPFTERFLPNQSPAFMAANYRFFPPLVFSSPNVPKDAEFIAPLNSRPVAVIRFEPSTDSRSCSPEDAMRFRSWIDTARRLNINSLEANLSLAMFAYNCGDLDEAIKEFSLGLKSYQHGPTRASLLYLLGSICEGRKLWDEAISYYRKAMETASNYAWLEVKIGNIYREKGEFERAKESYRRALELNDKWASPHLELGYLYIQTGDIESAMEEHRQAVSLRPQNAWYHVVLGDTLVKANKYDEALSEYQQAVALEPQYGEQAWYYVRLGDLYRRAGEVNKAIEAYRRAVDLPPYKAWHHILLGDALMLANKPREALTEYERALRLEPDYENSDWYHTRLGRAYRAAGKVNLAIRAYERALDLNEANEQANEWLKKLQQSHDAHTDPSSHP